MANWQDFTISLVQAVIFTVDDSTFTTARAVSITLQEYSSRFDGEMEAMKLPPVFPPELPHVILRSSDGAWRMQMSPARIDSVWTKPDIRTTVDLGEVVTGCSDMLQHYARHSHAKVKRVSLVVRRFFPTENPAGTLIERFCSEASKRQPFNRSSNFEIHNHKVYRPKRDGIDYDVNSWVRCMSAQLVPDGRPTIGVLQDLNTLATDENSSRFTQEQIKGFFQMAGLEVQEILARYFPEEVRS